MKINLAKSAGFCTGVKLAVAKALEAAAKHPGRVYMLGDIVHNEIVVKKIDNAGVRVVKNLTKIPRGSTILIRAHGTVPEVYKRARSRGLKIIDATCPLVADIHKEAKRLAKQGWRVVIIGDKKHDEVVGIAGQVANPIVISEADEVDKLPKSLKSVGVVVQSTQRTNRVQEIIKALVGRVKEIHFVDTICQPTKLRQQEIQIMPKTNDVIIVIGSASSANTKRLVEIARKQNAKTHRVMTAADLRANWFKGAKTVGVTAGASTPDEVINEVMNKLKSW